MFNGNIIMLGKPACGKGTLCKSLIDKYGYSIISTGDILRSETKSGSRTGKIIMDLISKGNLVPDQIIFDLMVKELKSIKMPFIIDGTPRTINQGEHLDKVTEIGLAIFIDVSDEICKIRIKERGISSGRDDDKNPDIVEKRLQQYKILTEPLVEFYKNKKILAYIDGEQSKENVMKQAENILKLWK